jgi:hypothetical protein
VTARLKSDNDVGAVTDPRQVVLLQLLLVLSDPQPAPPLMGKRGEGEWSRWLWW